MAFNNEQFRSLIRRTLQDNNLYSKNAVELLMLTSATESNLGTYLQQVNGPALGVFQMEPRTHDDIWRTHGEKLSKILGAPDLERLEADLRYAIIMSRFYYLRIPHPLPDHRDVEALATYWKTFYNTKYGKGKVEEAIEKYERYAV